MLPSFLWPFDLAGWHNGGWWLSAQGGNHMLGPGQLDIKEGLDFIYPWCGEPLYKDQRIMRQSYFHDETSGITTRFYRNFSLALKCYGDANALELRLSCTDPSICGYSLQKSRSDDRLNTMLPSFLWPFDLAGWHNGGWWQSAGEETIGLDLVNWISGIQGYYCPWESGYHFTGRRFNQNLKFHDDIIIWKVFLHYWPRVRGIKWSLWIPLTEGQWCGALIFSWLLAQIKCWIKICVASDLRHKNICKI